MAQRYSAYNRRSAVTLVELLVVITIMVILLGVVLPLVRPSLEGRALREATRQVSTFLMAAQTQAIATGRDVSVSFIRDPANTGRSFQLRLCHEPTPWVGDSEGARAVHVYVAGQPGVVFLDVRYLTKSPFSDPYLSQTDALRIHLDAVANSQRLLKKDREIKFNFMKPRHAITTLPGEDVISVAEVSFGDCFYDQGGTIPLTDRYRFLLEDPNDQDSKTFRGYYIHITPFYPKTFFEPTQFQVFRLPQYTAAEPLELPVNTCVDLSVSGIGRTGTIPGDVKTVNDKNITLTDKGADYFMVTFDPSGAVSDYYFPWDDDNDDAPDGTIRCPHRVPVLGTWMTCPNPATVYLMIGRPNRVVDSENKEFDGFFITADSLEDFDNNSRADFLEDQVEHNLEAADSLWVTIDHRTGSVSTTSNAGVEQALEDFNNGTISQLPVSTAVGYARSIAATSIGLGGR